MWTASFKLIGFSGIDGICFSNQGSILSFFNEEVAADMLALIRFGDKETAIETTLITPACTLGNILGFPAGKTIAAMLSLMAVILDAWPSLGPLALSITFTDELLFVDLNDISTLSRWFEACEITKLPKAFLQLRAIHWEQATTIHLL